MRNNKHERRTMKHFNVTILNSKTGREETHMYISQDRIFQNEDGESYVKLYGHGPSEVICTEEVIPPTWKDVTSNGRFSCE